MWPNVSRERLVELVRGWAEAHGHDAIVVFDGRAPEAAEDVVGSGEETADDWLTREAARLDRSAREDRLVVVDEVLERRHRLGDRGRRRPVQHDPHRSLVVVLDDEDDRAREVRIEQRRRRDQELAAERFLWIHAP